MGHPPADVWGYTPRQIAGFLYYAGKRHNREMAEQLATQANAAHAKPTDINKQIKELTKE